MEWIGWVATVAFASSYLLDNPRALKKAQAGAAVLWAAYGLIIHSMPVVVANILVAGMAVWSALVTRSRPRVST